MKAILLALLVLMLGAAGVLAADPLGDEVGTDRTIPLTTATTGGSTTTESGEDVPGPCDEPEHANDPRCAGAAAVPNGTTTGGTTTTGTTAGGTTTAGTTSTTTTTTTTTETRGDDGRETGEDVRGPCDEAEHANDPRCTGGAAGADDDGRGGGNSGPGGGSDDDSGSGSSGRGGGSDDDDRSGSNSGSG